LTISFDTSVLLGYYNSKSGVGLSSAGALAAGASSTQHKDPVPTAPWSSRATAPVASDLAKSVLAGHPFIDVNSAKLDVQGSSDAYRNLFALYSGLDALQGLTDMASAKNVPALQLAQIQRTFTAGMKQISDFVGGLDMDRIRVGVGQSLSTDKTTIGTPATNTTYTTRPIYTGDPTQAVPAFQGDVQFDIAVKQVNTTKNFHIDLGQMGSTPRTLNNVVAYINDQLGAQGVRTKFAIQKQPNPERSIQVGGKTVTLPATAASYALQVKGDTAETVTFSAAATAGAVYVAQTTGAYAAGGTTTTTNYKGEKTTTTTQPNGGQQIFKLQTDTSTTPGQPPAAVQPTGQSYNVDGRVFSDTLDPNIAKVRQTVTGADGSLYVLADVTGKVDGQTIQGAQDVALMKYDTAGNLLYTRTLGAADEASGLALSVASDGKVAIAGSVKGALDPGVTGSSPAKTDSFVTVFDAKGQEIWTQRRATRENDQATAVAFGADGTVYVAGQASSNMPGATAIGGQDGYLEAFKWNGLAGDKSKVTPVFTTQFGSTGTDKVTGLAVNGSTVVVGGTEGPDAVLRQFDVSGGGAPTLTATRDLGDLKGGSIAGVGFDANGQIVVAGTTHNGALAGGTAVKTSAGGSEAFIARFSSSIAPSGSDTIAYVGGSGDDTASAMAIQGTDVWLTGQAGTGFGGAAVGSKDGYVARIDPSTGAVEYVRRFTGDKGQATPTSIAVDTSGSSALDRLGLPQGTLAYTDSPLLTASTSLRAGDQFFIRGSEGGLAKAVTIAATDTMDTLALKIQRASDFNATVKVVTVEGQRQLRISPINSHASVEILPGGAGKDALGPLGMQQGVIQSLTGDTSQQKKVYGLKLAGSYDLTTTAGAKAASDALLAAMSSIRSAYTYLKSGDEPAAAKNPGKTGGTAPQYLTDQIASYQAALNRLTGGQG
jgi:hypothetical protein